MAGSIEKRGENSYRLTVSLGTSSGGKRKRYRKTIKVEGKTEAARKKQAEKELAKFIAEVEGGDFVKPNKVTFKAFSKKWLDNYAIPNLASKTIYDYESLLKLRLLPTFGHMYLNKIKPMHILEFYKKLQGDNVKKNKEKGKLSNNTIIHYHRLLRVMFNSAVKWQIISSNPMDNVDPPKLRKKEAKFYDQKELKKLLKALREEELKYKVAVIVTISGGLRIGELMGLKWDYIDFDNNTIKIVQSSQYLPSKGVFTKEPKNTNSIRTISMPQSVIDLLAQLKEEELQKEKKCDRLWKGEGFLFTQWNGTPMNTYTPSKWFSKFLKRKGLKKITFHQLRHTNATMLINAGINVKALSSRLGHSNTSTTLNIYSHALQSVDKVVAEKIEQIMFNK